MRKICSDTVGRGKRRVQETGYAFLLCLGCLVGMSAVGLILGGFFGQKKTPVLTASCGSYMIGVSLLQ